MEKCSSAKAYLAKNIHRGKLIMLKSLLCKQWSVCMECGWWNVKYGHKYSFPISIVDYGRV